MSRSLKKVQALVVVSALMSLTLVGVAAAAIPGAPTNLVATPHDKSVSLSWTASTNTPTDYLIEYSTDSFASYTMFYDGLPSTVTTATVTGLTNGLSYSFRVMGKNGEGTSAASTTASTIPVANNTPNDLAVFDACPAVLITAAGFSDTTSPDVACVKYYEITKGTTSTTFSPLEFVSRWQMALFLTRMVGPAGGTLPSGVDQGFIDISGKSIEIQAAINQIKQMGITVGKTATTYAPDDLVTRGEMALFIARLLKTVTTGPGGNEEFVSGSSGDKEIKSNDSDHNFSDLSLASTMEMQNAIVNLWNLGVTEVAGATQFEATTDLYRLNMAQMMARALDHTNARPVGLSLQASLYSSAATGTLSFSATHRTPDFLPIVGSPVDTFKYQANNTLGYSTFSSDGSCAQTEATIVAITKCYVDSTEPVTDVNGNLATFISAVIAGTVWDYYAWTASLGTTYDNDVHATGVSKVTING